MTVSTWGSALGISKSDGMHALRDAGVTPTTLFGLTPLFDKLPLPCHVVSP